MICIEENCERIVSKPNREYCGKHFAKHNMVEVICEICNSKYKIRYSSYIRNTKEKHTNTCSPKCRYEIQKNNMLKKYGVENVSQLKTTKEKKRGKCGFAVTGVPKNSHSQEANAKRKKTCLEKYGVDNPTKNKLIVELRQKRHYDKIRRTRIAISEYIKVNKGKTYSEIGEVFGIKADTVGYHIRSLSAKCDVRVRTRSLEEIIKGVLDRNNIKYVEHDRTIIKPYELDFVLQNNIAIEVNDVWTHTIDNPGYGNIKPVSYHSMKKEMCKEHKINLLHFYEWQVYKQLPIVESIILSKLGMTKKIYARKCELKIIDTKIYNKAVKMWHIQGIKKSDIMKGLYYNDELVAVAGFSKFLDGYELDRFCCKLKTTIVGGFSKLIKGFNILYSYSNNDISNGNVYIKNKFIIHKKIKPSYYWVNKNDYRCYNWATVNRLGADKLLKTNYGKGTSNKDIMLENNFRRIYNSGSTLYRRTNDIL